MSSLNKVLLIGNVGRDPEIRRTERGDRVATFSMAMTERWTDKQSGEKVEKTEWVNVKVWNDKLAEVVERYVRKGKQLYIEGKLTTREYEGQDGQKKYFTEVLLQGFNGQLVLLGRADDDRAGRSYDDRDDGWGSTRRDDRGERRDSFGRGDYGRNGDDRGRPRYADDQSWRRREEPRPAPAPSGLGGDPGVKAEPKEGEQLRPYAPDELSDNIPF